MMIPDDEHILQSGLNQMAMVGIRDRDRIMYDTIWYPHLWFSHAQ